MFKFKISSEFLPDGPQEVESEPRDLVKWERITKGASFGQLSDPQSLTYTALYRIAWIAAGRLGLVDCTLGEFETEYNVELVDEPDEDGESDEDPTLPAR